MNFRTLTAARYDICLARGLCKSEKISSERSWKGSKAVSHLRTCGQPSCLYEVFGKVLTKLNLSENLKTIKILRISDSCVSDLTRPKDK